MDLRGWGVVWTSEGGEYCGPQRVGSSPSFDLLLTAVVIPSHRHHG